MQTRKRVRRENLKPKTCEGCSEDFAIRSNEKPVHFEKRRFCTNTCANRNAPKRWKGPDAGYGAVHMWMNKEYPRLGFCAWCGKTAKTHWANLDGQYNRHNPYAWAELCFTCHHNYDTKRADQPKRIRPLHLQAV